MIPDVKIERTNKTIYALCNFCGFDVLWPSWCKCNPKRVYSAWDLSPNDEIKDQVMAERANRKVDG